MTDATTSPRQGMVSLPGIDPTTKGLLAGTDQEFLDWIVEYLQNESGFAYAFVGELVGADWNKVQTLAIRTQEGSPANFTYDLAGTPCERVVGSGVCEHPRSVARAFPEDRMLVEMGIESYIGTPLRDAFDRPLGLIVLMHTRELRDDEVELARALISAFRPRTALTLIHRRAVRELASVQSNLDATSHGRALPRLLRELTHGLHVRSAFVALPSRHDPSRQRTLVMIADERAVPSREFVQADTPFDRAPSGQNITVSSGLRERYPGVELFEELEAESFLGTTYHSSSGELLGQLAILHDRPIPEDLCELPLFRVIQQRIGYELERDSLLRNRLATEQRMYEMHRTESLGVLAGGIAHDFNNLLVAMMGNADLGLEVAQPDTEVYRCFSEISVASERAADLCRQMLVFAGRAPAQRRRFDVARLVQELRVLLEVSLARASRLELILPAGPVWMTGDETQIRQVVMNLVTNASEAMARTGGKIELTVALRSCGRDELDSLLPSFERPPGRYVFIEVADTGCGMSAETRRRMFDPFFTTKEKGHGLGLAALQGVVRTHGGGVRVESVHEVGTSVAVYLPPGQEQEDQQPEVVQPGGRPVVLVVDDEVTVLSVASSMLTSAGYDVITAGDGVEMLALFEDGNTDVACVLLDLTMPQMNGGEALRKLREMGIDIPVILSTGYAEEDVMAGLGDARPSAIVFKPYRLRTLVDKVRELVPVS